MSDPDMGEGGSIRIKIKDIKEVKQTPAPPTKEAIAARKRIIDRTKKYGGSNVGIHPEASGKRGAARGGGGGETDATQLSTLGETKIPQRPPVGEEELKRKQELIAVAQLREQARAFQESRRPQVPETTTPPTLRAESQETSPTSSDNGKETQTKQPSSKTTSSSRTSSPLKSLLK